MATETTSSATTRHSPSPFQPADYGGRTYIEDANGENIALMLNDVDQRQKAVDVRLFCAAPDLVAACETVTSGTIEDDRVNLRGDCHLGLMCGVEDRNLQKDGYAAAEYGFHEGVARAMEWVRGELDAALAKAREVRP